MVITIQNTEKVVTLDGVPARIWEGTTDSGIEVICFITRVLVPENDRQDEFLRELQQCEKPSIAAEAISLHLIL
ncbi:MAG: hypothetical protein LUM44_09990 [Pyrinomonadaceae bacterium]|nr:hypothetical protein [Pyrinomonadaceae bacterium]